nr:MAG TPA: hypothetical protein [Caudoviricetes sp.]
MSIYFFDFSRFYIDSLYIYIDFSRFWCYYQFS